jgi:hypothetical protein
MRMMRNYMHNSYSQLIVCLKASRYMISVAGLVRAYHIAVRDSQTTLTLREIVIISHVVL